MTYVKEIVKNKWYCWEWYDIEDAHYLKICTLRLNSILDYCDILCSYFSYSSPTVTNIHQKPADMLYLTLL